ncbi:histidine phosphatase family protein [Propionibacteriaceae bacterium G1746]
MTTTLILLRHGQTDWNAEGRFQGQHDVPLNDVGIGQAETAGRALATLRPEVIYCSPLGRTRQTAEPLARITGLEPIFDDRLKEIHVGTWEGLSWQQVDELEPSFREGLRAGKDMRRSAEGENAMETGERSAAALRDIAAAHHGQRVVVVSHGIALKQGIAQFLGWDWEHSTHLGHFDNCSWAVLQQVPSGWVLAAYNVNAQAVMALLADPSAEQQEV